MLRPFCSCLITVTTVALVGCGGGETGAPATENAVDPVAVDEAPATPPATEAQAKTFADELLATIGDAPGAKPIDQLLDMDSVLDKSLAGVDLSEKDRQGLASGVSTSLLQRGIVEQLRMILQQGGSYSFVRSFEDDGRRHLLMRLLQPNSEGVNYHDFYLTENESGEVVASDMYIFMSGETISQTLRRTAVQLAAQQNRSLLSRITGDEVLFVKHLEEIGQLSQAVQGGNADKALGIYRSLPQEVQDTKLVLLLRLQSAGLLVDDPAGEYESAIKHFRKLFPDDAAVDFLSIDYYLLTEKFDKCLEAIDRVQSELQDPYMHTLKAAAYVAKGDLEAATKAANQAIEEEPTLEAAYATALTVSLEKADHEETLKHLRTLTTEFGYEWGDLTTVEGYEQFVQSPQYKTFQTELN